MDIWVVVPVKRLSESKVRLASSLSPIQRRDLALKMLQHVLKTLKKLTGHVMVIGSDDEVKKASRDYDVPFVADKTDSLNRAVGQAIDRCVRKGSEAVLIVAADLPFLSSSDLEQLLETIEDESVTICPSKDCGTNALFLRPPEAIPTRFGSRSLLSHIQEAMRRGRKYRIYWSPGLSFDVDTPEDLRLLEPFSR